jgi:hypothetical protein
MSNLPSPLCSLTEQRLLSPILSARLQQLQTAAQGGQCLRANMEAGASPLA